MNIVVKNTDLGPDPDPIKIRFNDDGYVHLRGFFDPVDLDAFERQITVLFAMQARKIGEYRDRTEAATSTLHGTANVLTSIVEMMESDDKEALYQTQKFFPSCQALRRLFGEEFMNTCANLIGGDRDTTLLDGPALFVNRPNTVRLLYKWHSEQHYYPCRRRFLNCWFPLFSDKHEGNGTMAIIPRTHKRDWPFAEYTGYDKDTEGRKNHFLQYEIPKNFLTEFEPLHIEAKRGDLILFHRNLVHTSNPNRSGDYSFAVVARVWDPSDDLTLSGGIAATPYGGNIGRANLIVRP